MTLALALSGGNALGAYQAGAYQALHEAGLEPAFLSGASVGAINGALIAGNAREERLARLRAFWQPATADAAADGPLDSWRRSAAVAWSIAAGRPQLFHPRGLLGTPDLPSLFDSRPLRDTLLHLADFDRLNAGPMRYVASAVDLETGDDVLLDSAETRITPDHVRASGALLPAFQPVEIEGRLLGDAGLSANLPIDAVLTRGTGERPLLLVAIDLLPLSAPRPATLGNVVERMQDLSFATQGRRALEAWQTIFDLKERAGDPLPSVTLLHVLYTDQRREVAGKSMDFSPASVRERWQTGARDMREGLARIASGAVPLGAPGLAVHRVELVGK
ncbi:patatin [Sphingomonas aracearum]|uniref:Patatin n=2 Tax=Sphingomonas aracearum TaxID=2283317 RepID=A0A369VYU6_9SPHN|nr:patatin [Sphingomonas aracearum]